MPFAILWWILKERKSRIFKGEVSCLTDLLSFLNLRLATWVSARKDFANISINDIVSNWEAYMLCCLVKERRVMLRRGALDV